MTVIEATSGTYRSRVDGTLVLSVEIEPRHRDAALKLFGMPGTAMALAALKPASSKPEKPEQERQPVGPLCLWAVQRCDEEQFQDWIMETFPALLAHFTGTPAERIAGVVRNLCGVASRRELDTNEGAAALLHKHIRLPYAAWLKKNPK